jgi:dihydropteroate synthase
MDRVRNGMNTSGNMTLEDMMTGAGSATGRAVRPLIMGIINVTPDSFSDGGDFLSVEKAVDQGRRLIAQGADIIDVGGESTRPGAAAVSTEDELARVIPVIRTLADESPVPVSIDTYKAAVAEAAVEAGAVMINDVGAGRFDPRICTVAAEAGCFLTLMHMKGEPRNMQVNPSYENVVGEIITFLTAAASHALEAGVPESRIIIDPGIGFGKTFDHNLVILNHLDDFLSMGFPMLVGLSRKAFLGKILTDLHEGNPRPPKERDGLTAVGSALAAYKGARIVRVHNVAMTREALALTEAIMKEHA